MPDEKRNPPPQPKRGPINLDYRFLSLLLISATRADLFEEYLTGNPKRNRKAGWHKLHELGLPHNLLVESLYLFQLPETQRALKQLQNVTQTLVELNDYCETGCPSDNILQQIVGLNALQNEPLPPAGTEPD